MGTYICTECGKRSADVTPFCQHCGARWYPEWFDWWVGMPLLILLTLPCVVGGSLLMLWLYLQLFTWALGDYWGMIAGATIMLAFAPIGIADFLKKRRRKP
jgi:hypothetical protein